MNPKTKSESAVDPEHVDWELWDRLIGDMGIKLDRPEGTLHPEHEDIRYPIDYGFILGTMGADGSEVDIFVGSSENGLVGAIFTTDHRKNDKECKFIFNCTPEEIYLVNGFINFNQDLMQGHLVLRRPMRELWNEVGESVK